jgi:hypothetical protein
MITSQTLVQRPKRLWRTCGRTSLSKSPKVARVRGNPVWPRPPRPCEDVRLVSRDSLVWHQPALLSDSLTVVLVFNNEGRTLRWRPGFGRLCKRRTHTSVFRHYRGPNVLQIFSRIPEFDNHSSAPLHSPQLADRTRCGEL